MEERRVLNEGADCTRRATVCVAVELEGEKVVQCHKGGRASYRPEESRHNSRDQRLCLDFVLEVVTDVAGDEVASLPPDLHRLDEVKEGVVGAL